MKETNTTTLHIEKALSMYKENVSPSETYFQAILSQIPEQQKLKEGRAIRSPYRWLAFTQVVTVCAIVIAILPASVMRSEYTESIVNPYYEIDSQVEAFERQIDQEDYEKSLADNSL
ncbi:MAG: hypothetical protein RLZZ308_77 [Candidatus Parcubacteria bacterium]|jgi:hypothetical protein